MAKKALKLPEWEQIENKRAIQYARKSHMRKRYLRPTERRIYLAHSRTKTGKEMLIIIGRLIQTRMLHNQLEIGFEKYMRYMQQCN